MANKASPVVPFVGPKPVATPEDHLALRALLKYMSGALGIQYKVVCLETTFAENDLKAYANEKALRGQRQQAIFEAVSVSAAKLLPTHVRRIRDKSYILHIARELFGDTWLKQQGIEIPDTTGEVAIDRSLAAWLGVSEEETADVERDLSGLWRVVRASSPPGRVDAGSQSELAEINYSLLNIRPRHVGGNTLCDFYWYYRGRGGESGDERVSEGFVIPTADRVEFLAKPSGRFNMLSLMAWSYATNPDRQNHIPVANGIALTTNSSNNPVGAHVRAFFIANSDKLGGEEFKTLRDLERADIGVKSTSFLAGLISADQYQRTVDHLQRSKPIIGFVPFRGNNNDG